MTIDYSKIKVGDVVGVRVVEILRRGDEVALQVDGGALMDFAIDPSAIVSHTPAPKPALKVGDRVLSPAGSRWEVVFIQDGEHVHFGAVPGNCHFPTPLSEVETWERV